MEEKKFAVTVHGHSRMFCDSVLQIFMVERSKLVRMLISSTLGHPVSIWALKKGDEYANQMDILANIALSPTSLTEMEQKLTVLDDCLNQIEILDLVFESWRAMVIVVDALPVADSVETETLAMMILPDGSIDPMGHETYPRNDFSHRWRLYCESIDVRRKNGRAMTAVLFEGITVTEGSHLIFDASPAERKEKADVIYPPNSLGDDGIPLSIEAAKVACQGCFRNQ